MKKLLLYIAQVLITFTVLAQSYQVEGIVTDEAGEGIPGITE